jgi:uncharacterized protein
MDLYIHTAPVQLPFAWDEPKRLWTLTQRGIDFRDAVAVFDGRTLEREDRRHAYGERRHVAIGQVAGRHLTIIYTDRAEASAGGRMVRRIISVRDSNRKEKRAYDEAFGGVPPR